MTDEQQEQQHSTVTTTKARTKHINLHKFLNVQQVISNVHCLLNCILQNVYLHPQMSGQLMDECTCQGDLM